jgi:ferredoxin-nitrate reductase
MTGATVTETEHRAMSLRGRAVLKTVPFSEPKETPREEYPLELTTGRTVHHFHTRTKTGRAEQLQKASPRVWVEIAASDASEFEVHDRELVRIVSPRGSIEAPVRVTQTRAGQVFVPFHYAEQAANELTMTVWDPVSKQPAFKVAAVRVESIDHEQ